ncbi:hypothetical protein Tco_0535976 [Tanacetum coccineum]
MHKEAQQAAGDPTSLRATSEERAHPQLSSDKTKSAKDGLKSAHTDLGANEESKADDISLKVKLEDLLDILKDTRSAFFTPDSLTDEPIIVSDESEEEEVHLLQSQKEELEQAKAKAEAEVASTKAKPSYLNINQLTELLSSPQISLDYLERLIKKHVRDMEIELPGDIKEIPTKLETFTFTISSLSSQVVELKTIQWELPAEFLNLPSQVYSVQEKLKTLDSLPSLLYKVTDTLYRLATMVDNSPGARSMNVPSAGKATASPAEGEKNTKGADTNLKDELVDLIGKNVMTQYYTKKLLFDKYCDKMLKRKKSPKITNYEVLTKKGHITLKIYKEDGSDEVILNLKTRLDQLTQTEQELKIDLKKPLKEQDPLNELNKLANKKRKRTSDLKDHSWSTKKHKSSSLA